MCYVHTRQIVALALIALLVPSQAHAQAPGKMSAGSNGSPTAGNVSPPSSVATLSELLSRRPFAPLALSEDAPPEGREQRSVASDSLEDRLRQRMRSRLLRLPQQISRAADYRAADSLVPRPRPDDIVDLQRQLASWQAVVAGDYQQAAARLHDALLAGRPATLAEMQKLAGGEQSYRDVLSKLAKAAGQDDATPAQQFLLAYHAAISGDLTRAHQTLAALAGKSPQIALDTIVRIRLGQLLD